MQHITSAQNKYVKLASSLKQRKYRQELRMFLVEGRRAIVEAQSHPELVEFVFISDELAAEPELLAGFGSQQVLAVDAKTLRHICSTENPQGIAAIMKFPDWDWDSLFHKRGVLLLLDRVADPGNMGSIFRSAWAFGVNGILLTPGCVDPFSPKVVRASMGAIFNVPLLADVSARQLDQLEEAGYRFMAADASQGQNYDQADMRAPLVVIIGSEAEGVSETLKMRCSDLINIPMQPEVDSLNVAAACAIIIAEIARQSRMRE